MERTALHLSITATAVLGFVGIVWGLAAGSQVMLLDGVFSVIGIATSWMLLRAAAMAIAGPSPSYPSDPSLSIAEEDGLRTELRRRLDPLPYRIWLNFELRPGPSADTRGDR